MSFAKMLGDKYRKVGNFVPLSKIADDPEMPGIYKKLIVATLQLKSKELPKLYEKGFFDLKQILKLSIPEQSKFELIRAKYLEKIKDPVGDLKAYMFRPLFENLNVDDPDEIPLEIAKPDGIHPIKLKPSKLTKISKEGKQSYYIWGKLIVPKTENNEIIFTEIDCTVFIDKDEYFPFIEQIKAKYKQDEFDFLICTGAIKIDKEKQTASLNAVDIITYSSL